MPRHSTVKDKDEAANATSGTIAVNYLTDETGWTMSTSNITANQLNTNMNNIYTSGTTTGGNITTTFPGGLIGSGTTIGGSGPYVFGPSPNMTWTDQPEAAPREKNMATICKRHENKKYWFEIMVQPNDQVQYRIFYKKWYRRMFRNVDSDSDAAYWAFPQSFTDWKSVSERSTLEATIGAAYLSIDEAVKEDWENVNHASNVMEILKKADFDGMKMISELEKLENGPPEGEAMTTARSNININTITPPLRIINRTIHNNHRSCTVNRHSVVLAVKATSALPF